MSAYRFCRTDDIPLLVEAWNRCYLPHDPGAQPWTVAELKREIREIDLWCSSCMVGLEADEPVAVLVGCKRPPWTLVRRIAVHPGHLRKGHGRHLLTSLSAKLAILGPRDLRAEIPADNAPALGLFAACGWRETARYEDGIVEPRDTNVPNGAFTPIRVADVTDLLPPDEALVAWECSCQTLTKRADALSGLAIVTVDRLEAAVLYSRDADGATSIWWTHGPETGTLDALLAELARREGAPVMIRRGQSADGRGRSGSPAVVALAAEARGA